MTITKDLKPLMKANGNTSAVTNGNCVLKGI